MMSAAAPRLAACFALIALMDLVSRVLGMRRVLRLAHRLAGNGGAGSDPRLSDQIADRVATAAAFYPRRALCLEQSLALYVLLKRRGLAAELKLGVQARPFYAHLWVESSGRAIREESDLPLRLATFSGLGA
ncbi:MAG: lasso peptide biosynthesis B2 protein [Gemmatimonadota bacterium]